LAQSGDQDVVVEASKPIIEKPKQQTQTKEKEKEKEEKKEEKEAGDWTVSANPVGKKQTKHELKPKQT